MHWQTSEMGGQFPPGRRSGWGVLRCQVISFGPRAPKPAGDLRIDKAQVSAYISAPRVRRTHLAQVAELVDALVSGPSGAIRGGSSPLLGTIRRWGSSDILDWSRLHRPVTQDLFS